MSFLLSASTLAWCACRSAASLSLKAVLSWLRRAVSSSFFWRSQARLMSTSCCSRAALSFSSLRSLKLKSSISSFFCETSFSFLLATSSSPSTFSSLSAASFRSSASASSLALAQCSSFCLRASAMRCLFLASSSLTTSSLARCRSTQMFLVSMRNLISQSSAVLSLVLWRLSSSWRMMMSCSRRTTLRSQYSMSLSGTSIIRYYYITHHRSASYHHRRIASPSPHHHRRIISHHIAIGASYQPSPHHIAHRRIYYIANMMRIVRGLGYSQLAAYTRRGRHRPQVGVGVGDSVGGWAVRRREWLGDFELTHLELEHGSGARLHHLECAEENNTLSLVFRAPSGKKGVNLALEKLLQCGSRKYAVRDLAAQASLRSFSRVLPAQTTDQYLMFSFHSPILRDFSNLLNVYSSMLFAPLLRREDFEEVVRRFTFDQQRLGFTGELAAELYDAQFQLDQTVYALIGQELLGADHSCRSLDLAHLSYEDVLDHYHRTVTLSNCTLILHGDISPHYFADQLARNIEEFQPKVAAPAAPAPAPAPAAAVSLPKTVNFEHLRQETLLMLSFRIDGATDEEVTLLEILSYLLFDMPESPFMRFNSPDTPYPPLYGFRQRYFNLGISFKPPASAQVQGSVEWFREREKLLIEREAELLAAIREVGKKLDERMVEKCLMHLESNYYDSQGINIIESVTERLLQGRSLTSALQVTALVSRLLRSFRKDQTFEKLMKKFIIDNNNYVVLRGFNNPHIIEYENNRNRSLLIQMQGLLSQDKLAQIANYTPATFLQDTASLPVVAPSELESFQDLAGEEETIGRVRTVFNERSFGNRFTLKFDLTDLGDEDIPILALFCKAFPRMGYRAVKKESYQGLLENYVGRLEMRHETVREGEGLKVYAYLSIEFTDRNHEFAFSTLNGLLTDFDHANLMALSRAIHDSASDCFHDVSQNLLHYHGVHLAASRSPFAFFESPIYQARTLCALAADVKKVANPKTYLVALSRKFEEIWRRMMGWSRVEVLWECRRDKKAFYHKYLNILLKQIENEGIKPDSIDVSDFPAEKWQKYFPNYDTEMAFEAFTVPYRTQNSPAALVLASLVNHSIATYNQLGGCFLFKGSLVAFIQGGRQKYLELEDHYRRIDDLDVAKRKIFQSFSRYTVDQQFRSGVSFQQARFFKEAVIAVDRAQVEAVLETCLLSQIRKGSSSQLALGPKLENYEPLMKKGWEIERSIEDVSLAMESLSRQELTFRSHQYVDIC